MAAAGPRRAVFGGSFDPIHHGHLMVAQLLLQLENLDEVVFVPAAQSPHKRHAHAAAEARLRMVEAAIDAVPGLACSRVEVDRDGPSWTIDTIRHFRSQWGCAPFLIVGGDALLDLHTWHQADAIRREAQLLVYARPQHEAARQAARELGVPYHDEALSWQSSSELRRMAARGLSLRWQVPESVRRIIESERLYTNPPAAGVHPPERRLHP